MNTTLGLIQNGRSGILLTDMTNINLKKQSLISQEYLKEILRYDPNTGVFMWIKPTSKRTNIGDIAGNISNNGYLKMQINKNPYLMHRLAWLYMTGKWPEFQIDHDDHIKINNEWINLNEATNQENHKNMPLNKNNSSGVCGVHWDKIKMKWQSRIRINGKLTHLGYFVDKFEAICSRLSANNKYGFHKNHGQ